MSVKRKLVYTAIVLATFFFCVEVVARVLVRSQWSPRQIEAITTHSVERGHYASHPFLPFVLSAEEETHNSLGFRGPEFDVEKQPDKQRIVCLGGSTTYGVFVEAEYAYPAQLEQLLNKDGDHFEVINAGIPAYTSTENLLNLQLRVLPLRPDIVFVYQGRNDLAPQCYRNYSPDYSHFRRRDYHMCLSNYIHKPLFRCSHAFIIVATFQGERLGWSDREENPIYGSVRRENEPTAEEVVAHLQDSRRDHTFRDNVRAMIALCQANEIKIVFGTMAFDANHFRSGVLKNDPMIFESLQQQLADNNNITREVCAAYGIPVVETAALAQTEQWLLDDCHMKKQGHAARAKMILDTMSRHGLLSEGATPSDQRGNQMVRAENGSRT